MTFVTVCKMYARGNALTPLFCNLASLQILHTSTVHGAHCAHINMEFHTRAISKLFLPDVTFTVHVVLCLQNT